ncbi:MAG: DJ-1/PfpI family protein [Pseudomonadota bacterium]
MSISAKSSRIIFVCFEGLLSLDLTGPADIFSIAARHTKGCYEVLFVGTKNTVSASNGLTLRVDKLPKVRKSDTIVVPGGGSKAVFSATADSRLMNWLRKATETVDRTVAICSGAFLLAHLGVLDNRKCVTHWMGIHQLSKYAPNAFVMKEEIFVEDKGVWTSAGVTAGIDLALAIVDRDHGEKLAVEIARIVVVQVMRPGNQSQYSKPLALQIKSSANLSGLVAWLESRISTGTSVFEMAEAMGMSERQFYRQCVKQFGETPAKLFLSLKLDHARNHLQEASLPTGIISEMCGFSSSEAFSKSFKKQFGISPATYRTLWGPGGNSHQPL